MNEIVGFIAVSENSYFDALRNLVPFVQFKKPEKHSWRSVNFSKVAGFKPATLLKLTLLHGCFSRFLNCANVTKSHNAPHIGLTEFEKINWLPIHDPSE